jgi:hypothetical protein
MNPSRSFVLAIALCALATRASAYPGGTPGDVTDVAPFCAGCHSSVSEDQLQGLPPQRATAEVVANKHIAKIKAAAADSAYAKLSPAERDELIAGIQKIDAATTVKLSVPASVKSGEPVDVTVEVHGGSAPVLGIALVDANQRFQAAPATSRGWLVLDKPQVTGPDGQPQTKFTDNRNPALPPGITYVNVYGIEADPSAGKFSTVKVSWKLRAPAQAGTVPLAAVLLYGTEISSPHGGVESAYGKSPLGGMTGSSGRVKFSDVAQVAVK